MRTREVSANVIATIVLCAAAVTMASGVVGAAEHHSPTRGLRSKTFVALPTSVALAAQISLTPLSTASMQKVRVTPERALMDAAKQLVLTKGSWVSSISLGGYVNTSDIVHDWVGTRSKVPRRLALYVISVRGLHVASTGPSDHSGEVHRAIVLVNANSGAILGSFLYN